MAPPIPITIVTGFLGSGKTTLILNLIPQLRAQNPGYKLALLKNEFGDVAVDSQLASSSSISGVQELLNGCICCNLVGQLGPALAELETSVRPDRIVIETSGSAFPATLALEVNRLTRAQGAVSNGVGGGDNDDNKEVTTTTRGKYVLDGVVSVIDVENWQGYEDTSYTARIQARYTDLIVFNKWESAGEDRYDYCLDRVGDLEVDVAKVKSDRGKVAVDVIFGVDGALARNLTEDGLLAAEKHNGHQDGEDHKHSHQAEVEVLSVEMTGGHATSTEALLGLLQKAPKDEVYRIKALVTLDSTPKNSDPDVPTPHRSAGNRYILNWAFGRWTFTPLAETEAEHESSSGATLRMTVILGRYESGKWKKKLEGGGMLVGAPGSEGAELLVKRVL